MLPFGAEIWILAETLQKKLEGVHVGFLRQGVEVLARKMGFYTWKKEGAESVIQATETEPLQEYIEGMQEMVPEWVAL